MPTDMYS